jgi:hypothetical protein
VAWSTRGNATILDMGSAGSLAAGDTTAAHRFSGTLQFMAPEVRLAILFFYILVYIRVKNA